MGNEMRPFQRLQHAFAASIRDPENNPQPKGLPAQRIQIYRQLVYSNLEFVPCSWVPGSQSHTGLRSMAGVNQGLFTRPSLQDPLFV